MKRNTNTIMKHLRIKDTIVDEVQRFAEHENRNFNNMAETLIIRGMELTKNSSGM